MIKRLYHVSEKTLRSYSEPGFRCQLVSVDNGRYYEVRVNRKLINRSSYQQDSLRVFKSNIFNNIMSLKLF